MTLLESLITQQVNVSVVATLSRTTEKIAEQMAQEILKDPAFRARMRELVQRAFDRTFESLAAPPPEATP
jgi:ribosomal protein S3